MPVLFCLGQHSALVVVQRQFGLDERLMAFFDDLYVSCNPDRVVPIFDLLRHEKSFPHPNPSREYTYLEQRRGGASRWHRFAAYAGCLIQTTVRRGDHTLPPERQVVRVLGIPLCSPQFVSKELENVATNHQVILYRIPHVQDLQCACFCFSFVPLPDQTASF